MIQMNESHTIVFEVAVIRVYRNRLPSRGGCGCFGFHEKLRILFRRRITSGALFLAREGKCDFWTHIPIEIGFSKASTQKIEQSSILVDHRDDLNLLDQGLLLVACRRDKVTG